MGALAKAEAGVVAIRQESTMDRLLQVALENQAGMDVIERLSDLRRREMADAAEAAFNEAMHRAQEKMRRVGADAQNPQTHSRYASYAKLDSVLRPIYTGEGFSLSFNTEPTENPDTLRVVCYLSHKHPDFPVGHTRTYRIDMPADGKGAKGNDVMTKTHATGSASAYGMRYLLKMIFNVAVGETDDDGNGGGGITQSQGVEWVDAITGGFTAEEVMATWTNATNAAKKLNDYKAMTIFTEARDKRLKELKKAVK